MPVGFVGSHGVVPVAAGACRRPKPGGSARGGAAGLHLPSRGQGSLGRGAPAAAGGHLARHPGFRSRPAVCRDWQADACGGARSPLSACPSPSSRSWTSPAGPGPWWSRTRPNPWERVWRAVRWAHTAILVCTAWDQESPCHWAAAACSVSTRVGSPVSCQTRGECFLKLAFQDRFRLRCAWPFGAGVSPPRLVADHTGRPEPCGRSGGELGVSYHGIGPLPGSDGPGAAAAAR